MSLTIVNLHYISNANKIGKKGLCRFFVLEMILKFIEWKKLQEHFPQVKLIILILHNVNMEKLLFWKWLVNQSLPELVVTVFFSLQLLFILLVASVL